MSALVGSRVAIGYCGVAIDLGLIACVRSYAAVDFRLTPFAGSCLAVGHRRLAIEFGLDPFAGSRPTILRGSAPVIGGRSPGQF